jgi:hypothetical protein
MSRRNQLPKNEAKSEIGKSHSFNSYGLTEGQTRSEVNVLTHVYYSLVVLASIVFSLIKFPNFTFNGAMWAEMAVNYFPNSKSSDLTTVFLSKDAGYIPFGLRIVSWLYDALGISTAVIPYVYTFTAVIAAGMLVGFFCLKRFRILVESDSLRFLISIFVIFAADFETRTYINFTYFSLFFIFINVTIAFRKQLSTYVFLTFPILIFSKPILLSVLPIIIFVFISTKRNLIQKLTFVIILFSSIIQLIAILNSNSKNAFQQDTTIQFVDKIKNTFVYFFGTFAIPLNEFFATSVGLKVLIGISFVIFCLLIAIKASNQLSFLVYFALLTLFIVSLINTVAVSTTFGSNYSLLNGMPLFRYMIPIIDVGILLLIGTMLNCVYLLTLNSSQISTKLSWKLIGNAAVGLILIQGVFFSSKNIQEPISPALFNSQWSRMATVFDSGKPVCIPVDPAGWTYGRQCRLLNSDFNWINFGGYEQTLVVRNEIPFALDLPRDNNWVELQSLGILVKPLSSQNALGSAQLDIKLNNNKNLVVKTIQRSNSSGFLLFFLLSDPVPFSDIVSISFEASNDLILGLNSKIDSTPAVLFYGQ